MTRSKVFLGERELFADALCLCDPCDAKRESQAAIAQGPAQVWKRCLPEKYHAAQREHVDARLMPALAWDAGTAPSGLGITGPVGLGKTMTMALALLGLGRFRWVTGTALREVAITAASGDGGERLEARRLWERYLEAPILAIDDLDKAKFSEAWASKLFELLESRTSRCRPVFWTANHGPGQLAARITKQSDDAFAGEAIERRLAQHSTVISL